MEFLIRTDFFWHLGLALAGVLIAYIISSYITKVPQWRYCIAFFAILAIGYGYELYQGVAVDTGTDLVADIVGAGLGILILIIWDKWDDNSLNKFA